MNNATISTLASLPNLNLVAWTYAAQTNGIPAPIAEQEALFRNMLCGEDVIVAKGVAA